MTCSANDKQTLIQGRSVLTLQIVQNSAMANNPYNEVLIEIRGAAGSAGNLKALQEYIVEIIPTQLSHYNWTGFYMLDPDDPGTLVLGPFRGAPTEHVRIPVTEGICGAAVAQGKSVVIDDVSADPRYLACSIETKSEIVVPIRANGIIIGEIDIDSHDLAAFGDADQVFLEQCAQIVGRFVEDSELAPTTEK